MLRRVVAATARRLAGAGLVARMRALGGAVRSAASTASKKTAPQRAAAHASASEPAQATAATALSTSAAIQQEKQFAAHNYSPLPVVFSKARGVHVWDPEGKHYIDFLSAYSAVNQGHCHPRIVAAMMDQAERLTLSSRAFYNDVFPRMAKFITEFFKYDAVLPLNTGAEAVEATIKLIRKWGTDVRGVPAGSVKIMAFDGCFHGRTMGVVSLSRDADMTTGFTPLLPNIVHAPYGDARAVRAALAADPTISGLIIEPIQGEAGVIVPPDGYMRELAAACREHGVLLAADEIQTGLCRTGRMLCVDHDGVRPDVLILGKALSGGVFPVSAVLADRAVMDVFTPGTHGSTYGGNPVAAAVVEPALRVLVDEDLAANSQRLGAKFRAAMQEAAAACAPGFIKEVRGRGLFNAVELHASHPVSAKAVSTRLFERGILCKPTHETSIRFAPPLVITEPQFDESTAIMVETFVAMSKQSS